VIRFVVGDNAGVLKAELEVGVGPLSWRLNDVGKVQFQISSLDAKATEDNLRFGNRVLVEFDNGLPNWVGMIDTPRTWENGVITCTAYSGEYILGTRQTDRGRYFSDQTVGIIYQALIEDANTVEDTGIGIGKVWEGGPGHYPEYHFKNLLAIIRESLCGNLSDYDFDVTGSVTAGKISLSANLYERKGRDRENVVLLEGTNLAGIRYMEQGEIINWWDVAGAGDGWSETARIYSQAVDAKSRSRYGLRQGQVIYNDVSYQATLDENAKTLLGITKQPYRMLDLETVDLDPGKFEDYEVGDSVRVQLHSFGFGGYDEMVRVEAREYDPGSGACRLVVREV